MPNKNQHEQLMSYGPMAVELDRLVAEMPDSQEDETLWEQQLAEFIEFIDKNKLHDLVRSLAHDGYVDNRELAGCAILYLWEGRLILPYNEDDREGYEKHVRAYLDHLGWTLPVLTRLFEDERSSPVELAARVVAEMEDATEATQIVFRAHMITAAKSRFDEVRLAVVRNIANLYPDNDEARNIIDEPAMKLLLDATRDPNVDVRDWAGFTLWQSVENLDDRAKAAFRRMLQTEDPGSEAYVEAVTGLARVQGGREIDAIICARLASGDFGMGWVDAAIQSHSAEVLEVLIAAFERLRQVEPESRRMEAMDYALAEWNE